jgi:hypothetical protein
MSQRTQCWTSYGIAHEAVQPPTISSLITNAALGMITAGHDLRLNGYSAADIASIMSRAKVRTDAGIPLGFEDAPAVASAFQERGINIDEDHPMTRPLSPTEQGVYEALEKKTQQVQQEQAEGGKGETPSAAQPQLAPRVEARETISSESEKDAAIPETSIRGSGGAPALQDGPAESPAPSASESHFKNGGVTETQLDKATRTYITYIIKDENNNVRYVGRASGIGTTAEVMKQRIAKGHRIMKRNPTFTPEVIDQQSSPDANKGAEKLWHEHYKKQGANLLNAPKAPPLSDKLSKRENTEQRVKTYIDEDSKK